MYAISTFKDVRAYTQVKVFAGYFFNNSKCMEDMMIMAAEILMQVVFEPVAGEGNALALQTGPVVVNQAPAQYRDEGIVAKAPLRYALLEMHGLDMPLLAALHKVEFYKALCHVLACQHLPPQVEDVSHPAHKIPLHRGFPADGLP